MKNSLLLVISLLLIPTSPNQIKFSEPDPHTRSLEALKYSDRHLEFENQGLYGTFSSPSPRIMQNSASSFPTEILINSNTENTQKNVHLAPLSNGGFIASWQSYGQDPGDSFYDSGVFAQIFDSSGIPYQSEIGLAEFITGNQSVPKTAELSSGDFIAVWSNENNSSISGRCFNKTGAPKTQEFTINTLPIAKNPSVMVLPKSNEIIIVYQGYSLSWDIYMRVYSFECLPSNNESIVNTYTSNDQTNPVLASNDYGQYMIVWESNLQDSSGYGLYLKLFYENSQISEQEIRVNSVILGDQMSPRIQKLADLYFIVTWQSNEEDGSGWGAYAAYVRTIDNIEVTIFELIVRHMSQEIRSILFLLIS